MLYLYLKGEIVKSGFTIKKLAETLGISEKTLRNKLNGITDFTWSEALAIKKLIKRDADMEQLFELAAEQEGR